MLVVSERNNLREQLMLEEAKSRVQAELTLLLNKRIHQLEKTASDALSVSNEAIKQYEALQEKRKREIETISTAWHAKLQKAQQFKVYKIIIQSEKLDEPKALVLIEESLTGVKSTIKQMGLSLKDCKIQEIVRDKRQTVLINYDLF